MCIVNLSPTMLTLLSPKSFKKSLNSHLKVGNTWGKHDPWIISVGPKLNDSETKWFVEQLQKSVTKATPFLTKLPLEGRQRILALMDQYSSYKTNFVRNYVFDPASSNLSIHTYYLPI